jgi:hypothetical protein
MRQQIARDGHAGAGMHQCGVDRDVDEARLRCVVGADYGSAMTIVIHEERRARVVPSQRNRGVGHVVMTER